MGREEQSDKTMDESFWFEVGFWNRAANERRRAAEECELGWRRVKAESIGVGREDEEEERKRETETCTHRASNSFTCRRSIGTGGRGGGVVPGSGKT
jgi:hypothetical protein